MMVLTKRVNYGIRGLLNLARNNNQSFLKRISREEEIPESYLAKIFQVFVQRGILDSKKGPHGGFYLASDPKEISVGRVVECLEGEFNFDKCPLSNSSCERIDTCAIYSAWRRQEEAKHLMLRSLTIADILASCQGMQTPHADREEAL